MALFSCDSSIEIEYTTVELNKFHLKSCSSWRPGLHQA